MKVNFFLIGAQKSGTTTLQKILSVHNDIFVVPSEVSLLEDPWFSAKTFSELDSLLNTEDARIRGIKRPHLLFMPEIAERIKAYDQNARILIVLRDPIDRFVSAYFHHLSYRTIPFAPLNIGAMRILRGEYAKRWPISNTILDYGLYGKAIQHYRSFFTADQMLVLHYKDLSVDLEGVKTDLSNFFSIPNEWGAHLGEVRENSGLRSPLKVLFSRIAKAQTQVYEPKSGLVYMRPGGPKSTALLNLAKRMERAVPDLDLWKVDLKKDVSAALKKAYEYDQELLARLTGRRLF